jgi:hypothetical protein
MTFDDFQRIYEEMISLFAKDKELTHIEVTFNISPVITEKKVARINIKTYKDGNKINYKY